MNLCIIPPCISSVVGWQAREAVEMRAQIEKTMAQKEKERKEENLRQLAQKVREERSGIRRNEGKNWHTATDYSDNIYIVSKRIENFDIISVNLEQ